MPREQWDAHYELIAAIDSLKRSRDAIVLAHDYQRPEIRHGVADYRGDSLELARAAASSRATVVVVCGAHFMAEAAKLLAPDKTVLLPDLDAGCSLADSITAADVRALRARHPGVPVVCYMHTSAEVQAACDSCCTSANAIQIVENLGVPEVILVPDEDLASYVAAHTKVRIISWPGRCDIHERIAAPELRVSEAPKDVCALARPWRSSDPCPHMHGITLAKIRASLESMRPAIHIPRDVADGARRAVWRMLQLDQRRGR